MYRLNMNSQSRLIWILFDTLITSIFDTFMYRLNMLCQITLCCKLMVTSITRVMTGRVWQRAAYIRRYISFRCRHWIQLTPLRAELSQQWAAGACYQTQFTNYRCLLLSAYSLDTTSASCRWVAALLHDYQMWQRWEMSNQRQMVIK